LALLADPGRERLHPDERVRFLAALEKYLGRLAIVLEIKIVDKAQVLVESPEFRIGLDSALQKFDSQVGPARATRRRIANKHPGSEIRYDQIAIERCLA